MATKQFVVGQDPNAPAVGQTKFIAKFLKKVFVDFIVVNDTLENQLIPRFGV
jgi:hypothetical protein